MMRGATRVASILLVVVFIAASSARAQLSNSVAIHGFGGWAYGRTDNENVYLMGNNDGNYSHLDFSLNLSVSLHDDLRLYVQPGWDERRGGHEMKIDYAFAEWFWWDTLSFRIGKVKAPFMLYSELYSVGTIRPFFSLAQGIYKDTATEGYKGLGITGFFDLQNWEVQYDLYGGKLELLPIVEIDVEEQRFVETYPQINDTIGARIMLRPPLDGVNIAISSYSGENEAEQDGTALENYGMNDRYIFLGLSLEYLADTYEMRAEYLTELKVDNFFDSFHTAYYECAYSMTDQWQAAARYEYVSFETSEEDDGEAFPETLDDHTDLSVGLNYWISQNFVIKFAYHYVKGNHFAYPENARTYAENVLAEDFEDSTNLFVLGTQFSF